MRSRPPACARPTAAALAPPDRPTELASGPRTAVARCRISTPLAHWHRDVFRAGRNPDNATFDKTFLQFGMDPQGRIETVAVKLEPTEEAITFERAPDPRMSDVAYLQRFVGTYQIGPQTAVVALNGNHLTCTVAGQPSYTLLPRRDNRFALKGLEGYEIQFLLDPAGKVTQAIFQQPNGMFPAIPVRK